MPTARPEPIVRSLTLFPHLSEAGRGRALTAEIASEAGFPEERVFDIIVACSEAIANAIEHAPIKGEVQVRTVLHADRLEVEVQGPGEFQAPDRLKGRETRGLGLPLMAKLSDHVALFSGPKGGTFVGLTFYLPGRRVPGEDPVPPSIRELIEENELTAAITQIAPVGLYVLDPDLRFRWTNPAYLEFLEEPYRSRSLEGVFLGDAVPGSKDGGSLDILRRVSETGESEYFPEYEYSGFARGTTYWRWQILPLREERPGPPFDVLVVISEVTEQVAQRRQVEALGREAVDRAEWLTRLIDSMTDEVWTADREGRITLANPSASAEFGIGGAEHRSVEDVAGQLEVYRGDMTPRPREEAPPLRALAGEVIHGEEEIVRTPRTGELRTRAVNAAPIQGGDGAIIGSVSVVRDMTEHKRAEKALRESQGELSFALELNDALRQLDDPKEIQATAAGLLGERLGADRVFYGDIVVDDLVETLVIETDYHPPGITSLTGRFPFKEFSSTDYGNYRAGRTVSSSNVFTDERSESQRNVCRAANTAAFVGVPLVKSGELVSVLGVLQRQPRNWTAQEIRLAELTVDRTWQAIQRGRAEAALRESENKYRGLFDSLDQGFFVIDVIFDENDRPVDLHYVEANAAATRILGRDWTGKRLSEIGEGYEEYWFEIFGQVALTGECVREERYAAPEDKWWDFYVFKLGGPESRRIGNTFLDVTERKRAEEALHESENKYRTLFDSIDQGYSIIEVIFDADGRPVNYRFQEVNQAFERQTGIENAVGRLMRDIAPQHEQYWFDIYGEVARTGKPVRFENAADALGHYYDVCAFRVNEPEQHHVAVLFTDISAQRQASAALSESEERHRLLAEENERLYRQQLDIAENLQFALLNIPSEIGPWRIGHLYRSATEAARVGGDFYDVFPVKGGMTAVLIGDVSGHGIQAARTATLVKDVVHAFTHQSIRTQEVLKRSNLLLIEKDLPGFVTLFLGILDAEAGILRYSSAGHPDMMLRRASGEILLLGSGTSPLGIYADASWKPKKLELETNDLLLLYTDGVLEARRDGEMFGEKRLEQLLKRKQVTPERLPRLILEKVLDHSGGKLQDDVAVLSLLLADNGNGGSARKKEPFAQHEPGSGHLPAEIGLQIGTLGPSDPELNRGHFSIGEAHALK